MFWREAQTGVTACLGGGHTGPLTTMALAPAHLRLLLDLCALGLQQGEQRVQRRASCLVI